jgi:hypothetical protein
MPDSSSGQKLQVCRICGRPLDASAKTPNVCEQCTTLERPPAKVQADEPESLAVAGTNSPDEGEWITPSTTSLDDESADLDLAATTNWRSPPFVIDFSPADEQDEANPPRPKLHRRLLTLFRSRFETVAFAVLALGVLWFARYGVPKSFRFPGRKPVVERAEPARPELSSQQKREAAFRHSRDTKSRQQKAVGNPRQQ